MKRGETIFPKVLLIARPAAGKSEIIAYLNNREPEERKERFHLGKLQEIDDFPMLWAWYEEDGILEEMGHERIHTDKDGYFRWNYLWDVLIRRICLDYKKMIRDYPGIHKDHSVVFEFARGKEHGGYQRAFQHLTREVLNNLVVLYIDVSWEESLRKNRARRNPDRPDSILEHSLADEKLRTLYREDDWQDLEREEGALVIKGLRIPYYRFENQKDYTTTGGEILGEKLEEAFDVLWKRYQSLSGKDLNQKEKGGEARRI